MEEKDVMEEALLEEQEEDSENIENENEELPVEPAENNDNTSYLNGAATSKPSKKTQDTVLNPDGTLGRNKSLFPPRKAQDAVLNSDGTLGRNKSLFPPRKARDAVLNPNGSISRDRSLFPRKTQNKVVDLSDTKGKDNKHAKKQLLSASFKKLPLKVKLIIIGVIAGLVFVVIFLIILITPLMELGIIDIEGIGGPSNTPSFSYSSISSNTTYWWPIGSSNTTTSGGVTFASGEPSDSTITSEFGPRVHPITGEVSTHTGVDIADGSAPGTTNVIAVKDGTVIYPSNNDVVNCPTSSSLDGCGSGYGNYVMIQHSDGKITLYAHLYENSITVRTGENVKQGQVIGKMGSSGNSTGTHLHFEVRSEGSAVNPLGFVSIDNTRPDIGSVSYVNGDSDKQSVCLTLKAAGFSDNAVAALLTNISHESSFNPTVLGDNGTSYGLCQWHNGRYDNLRTTYPDTYHTIGSQIDYLVYELENKYVSVYSELTDDSTSASDLTYTFCTKFEIPADTKNTCTKRTKKTDEYYNYVINGCK